MTTNVNWEAFGERVEDYLRQNLPAKTIESLLNKQFRFENEQDKKTAIDIIDAIQEVLEQEQTHNNVISFPHMKEVRKDVWVPVTRLENTQCLLDYYNITARYNEMTKRVEVVVPGETLIPDLYDNQVLTVVRDLARLHGLPVKEIEEHIELLAQPYHPVREWIQSKEWDGVCRLEQFYATIETAHPMKKLLMKKWALGCVYVVMNRSGGRLEGTLCFDGKQGTGKTSWLKSLVPDPSWIKEGVSLNHKDKDTYIEALGAWITELGELGSTFRRSDIDVLKAFLSKEADHYRPPYAKKANQYPRRTAFFATTDSGSMLIDKAGNRRFWVLDVEAIHREHDIDLQQLWAEFAVLKAKGEAHWLDVDELEQLNDLNLKFEARDPVMEKMESWNIEPFMDDCRNSFRGNATAILNLIGYNKPTPVEVRSASTYLERHGIQFQNKAKRDYYICYAAPDTFAGSIAQTLNGKVTRLTGG